MMWTICCDGDPVPGVDGTFSLSRALVSLTAQAFQARESERFGLLYTLVWRAHHGTLDIDDKDDLDLRVARRWALAVRADAHRMRTLIRFAAVTLDQQAHFVGWYAPDHFVLEANARLLARRDPEHNFTIVTPDGTAHRDQNGLRFTAGLRHPSDDDTLLAWWDAHRDTLLREAHDGGGLPEAEELDEVPRPPDRPAARPAGP